MSTQTGSDLAHWFDVLSAMAASERADAVARLAQAQPTLAAELAALLQADAAQGGRVDAAIGRAHAQLDEAMTRRRSGERVGAWRVLEPIGAGGMGEVYRAERVDGGYQEIAAIKFLRGATDRDAQARFALERQTLAVLRHRNIAALLDGGTDTHGEPYLVMALIDGAAIDVWCAEHRLPLEARLKLFMQVCAGVDHAHRHLIVHCDLKPGNVLVDREGQVYVSDFGIARWLSAPDVASRSALTPGFASPEQHLGAAIGTASDIYSLGKVLECLTDGQRRSADLAAIIGCATDAQPERRYASARALANDVRCLIERRPLAVRGGAIGYRFGKWVQRQPMVAAAAVLTVVALAAFGWQLKRERDRALRAETAAEERATLAQQTTRFLVDVFRGADPARAQGRDIGARELLDQGYATLASAALNSDAVRAELYGNFGEIYQTIGLPQPALESFSRALDLLPDGTARAAMLERRSLLLLGNSQYDRALADAQAALSARIAAGNPADIIWARIALSKPLQALSRFDAASIELQTALAEAEALPERPDLRGEVLTYLGVLATRTEALDDAQRFLQQSIDIKRAVHGVAHPLTLDAMQALCNVLLRIGALDRLDTLTQELVAGRREVHGVDTSPHRQAQLIRTSFLLHSGALSEAESLSRESIAGFAAVHPEPVLEDSIAYQNLSLVLEDRGDFSASMAWLARCLAVRERILGSGHVQTLSALHQRARLHLRLGEMQAALRDAEAAFAARSERLGPAHLDTLESSILLGILRSVVSRQAVELDTAYAQWLPALERTRGPAAPPVARAVALLAEYDPDSARAMAAAQSRLHLFAGYRYLSAWLSLLVAERQQAAPLANVSEANRIAQWRLLHESQLPTSPRLKRIEAMLRTLRPDSTRQQD